MIPIETWQARSAWYQLRAQKHTQPARERRARGEAHPVFDFLSRYYPFPFALLEKWHPPAGEKLEWNKADLPPDMSEKWYRLQHGSVALEPKLIHEKELQRIQWTAQLLEATHARNPNFACHGIHEWAMVYRGKQIRHEGTLALRLPQSEIDELVKNHPITCSHHDAFRFFAPEAKPLNRLQPNMERRMELEQPGCLHANMDLYKWAAKSMPWVGSELLLDCYELALELRVLDMRASPYDLSDWGYEPICIETAEGRCDYQKQQRKLATAAAELRCRLSEQLRQVIAQSQCHVGTSASTGSL